MSDPLPAPKGTTIVIGRDGKSSAAAEAAAARSIVAARVLQIHALIEGALLNWRGSDFA